MTIDATTEFNNVRGTFNDEGITALDKLKEIAVRAKSMVVGEENDEANMPAIPWISDSDVRNESGFWATQAPDAPTEPDPNDFSLFTSATNYLDWLQEQALTGATFPTYEDLFPDEPPSEPTVDLSNPQTFDISTPEVPVYTVPTWDDNSAWSGGDLSLDGTIGPLTLPFVWTERSFTSSFMNGGTNILYEAIKADIESASYGLDELDEGRIWDRARERETRVSSANVEAATRLFASGGFTMPTGAAQFAVDRALSEARDKVLSASREVMIQKSALFLEAKKIAIANGLDLEKTTFEFYNRESEFLLKRIAQEITSTIEVGTYNLERIKMYIEKYKGYADAFASQVAGQKGIVEMYAAQVQAEGTKADANKAIYESLIAKNRVVIDQYTAALQGFSTVMDARVRYHGVLADVYKTQVSQISAYTDATKEAFTLVDKQHKNIIDFRVAKYNTQVTSMKNKLDELLGALQIKVDQLKTEAQSITAIAVGAMSAMNVNLGLSVGASTSIGGQESHSYDETKGDDSGTSTSVQHYYDKTKGTTSEHKQWNYNYSDEFTL